MGFVTVTEGSWALPESARFVEFAAWVMTRGSFLNIVSGVSGAVDRGRLAGARRHVSVPLARHTSQPTHGVLALQAQVGNQAVAQALAVQRGGNTKNPAKSDTAAQIKDLTPKERKWYGKKKEKKLTPEEKIARDKQVADVIKAVSLKVDACVKEYYDLVAKGMPQQEAAKKVFDAAPPDVKPHLPLKSEFDILRREINEKRQQEASGMDIEATALLKSHAKEHGYVPGQGDPVEMSEKEAAKTVLEEQRFQRQLERQAERRLAGRLEEAEMNLEDAKKAKDPVAIKNAEEEVALLKSDKKVDVMLAEMQAEQLEAFERIRNRKIVEHRKKRGVGEPGGPADLSPAEFDWIDQRSREKVREAVASGVNVSYLARGDAEKYAAMAQAIPSNEKLKAAGNWASGKTAQVGYIAGNVGAKKGAGVIGGFVNDSTTGATPGMAGDIFAPLGAGLGKSFKVIGGSFAKIIKILGQIGDLQSAKSDDDTKYELAGNVVGLAQNAANAARTGMRAAKKFSDLVATDPGLMTAIPIASIVVSAISIIGHVINSIPPSKRMFSTIGAWLDAKKNKKNTLVTSYTRSSLESQLALSTEVTAITGDLAIIGLSIAEVATGGGYGAPAGLKLGIRAIVYAKKASDWFVLEGYRIATEKARTGVIAGKEGASQGLFQSDITYALDAIIMAAQGDKAKNKAPDKQARSVVSSYGIPDSEIDRLTMREIHVRMLNKVKQDDEQKSVYTKGKDAWDSLVETAEEKIPFLKDDDEDADLPLDEWAKKKREKKEAKELENFGDKVGGYGKKIGGGALKGVDYVTVALDEGIEDLTLEKREKLRRIVEVKNKLNYKGKSDRNANWYITNGLMRDELVSERKLRAYIVRTYPQEEAQLFLRELDTEAEREKREKKEKKAAEAAEKEAKGAAPAGAVSKDLRDAASKMSYAEIQAKLKDVSLSPADADFLTQLADKASRLITPGFVETTRMLPLDQLTKLAADESLSPADRAHCAALIKEQGGSDEPSFEVKKAAMHLDLPGLQKLLDSGALKQTFKDIPLDDTDKAWLAEEIKTREWDTPRIRQAAKEKTVAELIELRKKEEKKLSPLDLLYLDKAIAGRKDEVNPTVKKLCDELTLKELRQVIQDEAIATHHFTNIKLSAADLKYVGDQFTHRKWDDPKKKKRLDRMTLTELKKVVDGVTKGFGVVDRKYAEDEYKRRGGKLLEATSVAAKRPAGRLAG